MASKLLTRIVHGAGAHIVRIGGRLAGYEQRLDDLLPLLRNAGFDAMGGALPVGGASRTLSKDMAVKELLGYAYGALKVFTGLTLSTPMEVQTKTTNPETGAAQWERDESHELNALLQSVNDMMTWPELMSLTAGYIFSVGSAFWLKQFEGGRVTSLWPLPAQDMTAVVKNRELLRWEQRMPNTAVPLTWKPEEIVHFVDPIPGEMLGFGRVQAAAGGVNLMAKIVDAQFNTMVNGGLPSLFVWMQENNDKKREEYFAQIKQGLKGTSQAGAIIGLPGPRGDRTEIEQIDKTTASEMGFDKSSQIARDLELGTMTTPQALLGITRETSKANVEGAELIYSKYTVGPSLIIFDARVNQDLVLPHWGPDVRIQHDSPVPRDRELDLKEAETRIKLGDTWNAVAAERGWPSHPWGDRWYASAGLLPIEDGETMPDDREEEQMFVAQLRMSAMQLGMSGIETQRMIATAATMASKHGNGKHHRPVVVSAAVATEKQVPLLQAVVSQQPRGFDKTRRRRLERAAWRARTPIRLAMRDAVARYFAEIEKRVLDAFDEAFPGVETQVVRKLQTDEEARELNDIINTTMDPEETAELLATRTAPFTARGIVLGGEFARNIFDVSLPEFQFDSRAAQRYAAEWSDAYWPELTRRQQREVKTTILRGIERQAGLAEIRDNISTQFSRWQELPRGRAMAIATTETTKMFNAGSQAFMEEAKVDFKQWIVSFVRTRDAHLASGVDGQTVRVDQLFAVGGERLPYPGSGAIPGNNINCHCISVPVPR